MSRILILRPQPGADETAEAARRLGLEPAIAPIFEVRPLDWRPPEPGRFDSVMITSANAARCGGEDLGRFLRLPCYAVGEASAAAARAAGFRDVRIGPGDGAALLAMMAADGVRAAFHPCGRDRTSLPELGIALESVPVYVADAVERLPDAAETALAEDAPALIHSPRAAALFARLVGERRRKDVALAAISAAAAAAAGNGWRAVAVAARPTDAALLALAAELCQTRTR